MNFFGLQYLREGAFTLSHHFQNSLELALSLSDQLSYQALFALQIWVIGLRLPHFLLNFGQSFHTYFKLPFFGQNRLIVV